MRRVGACAALLAALLLIGAGDAFSVSTSVSSLTIEVVGKGKVSGPGINCGNGNLACYAVYSSGTSSVSLNAVSGDWPFDHWDDDAVGCGTDQSPCLVTLTSGANKTVTAIFKTSTAVNPVTFNAAPSNAGGASSGPGGTIATGSTVLPIDCGPSPSTTCTVTTLQNSTITVTESPAAGNLFAGWGAACSGTQPSCSAWLTSSSTTAAANFTSSTSTALTVHVAGGGTVTGGGLNCPGGATCTGTESATSTVTLSATPQSGYAFTGWSGDCTGTQTTCQVQMNEDRDVTANFAQLVPVLITVNGNGTVTGAGVTCGPGPATCQGSSAPSTSILLTGTPAVGASVTWSGCTSISGNVCTLTVGTTALAVTATFSGGTPPPSTFTLSLDVSGNGYVTSSNGSVYCTAAGGSGCMASLAQNTTLTLTAVPASGSSNDFTDWGGDCNASTTTTCTLTMSSAKVVSAEFQGTNVTNLLSAQVAGTGSGTISGAGLQCSSSGGSGCSAQQAANASVTISATPSAGSTFSGWGGACSGTGSCKVSMTAAKSVTATFAKSIPVSAELTLTVKGGGTVKGTNGVVCTAAAGKSLTCTHDYAIGTKVTLNATPAKDQVFTGWKGACTGTKAVCSLTISAAAAVSATFAKPIIAASHKPTVAKVSGGYRVHLDYQAGVAGTLKLNVTRSGKHVLTQSKQVAAGKGSLVVPLKHKGRYVFTLTLTAKSGTQSIHWVVVV